MIVRTMMQNLAMLSLLILPVVVEAASSVGKIADITGDVAEAQAFGGVARKLIAGDAIFIGERIRTDSKTRVQILFNDKARFYLGPNAEFEVEKYQPKRQGAEGEAFHSRIFKGTFRFVSGLIARSTGKSMRVRMSVATIGIRGTHVEGVVIERQEIDGKMVDSSAQVVLLEPEEEGKQTSIEVSNEFGSVVIDQPGFGTDIPDEKSPPSPVRKMQLRTIDNIQRTLRSTVRQGGTARPRMP